MMDAKLFCKSGLYLLVAVLVWAVHAEDFSTYAYKRAVTINTQKAGITETLYNVPVLVRFNQTNFDYERMWFDFGEDVRFSKVDGVTPLLHDHNFLTIDTLNSAVWVLIDTLQANSTKQIIMHSMNENATDASQPEKVFSKANGFEAVWHFEEKCSSSIDGEEVWMDAGENGWHGVDYVSHPNGFNVKDGIIGWGQKVSGNWDKIEFPGVTWTPSKFSISWWMYSTELPTNGQAFTAKNLWGAFRFNHTSGGAVRVGITSEKRLEAADGLGAGTLITDEWQHFAYVFDGSKASFYINGQLKAGPKAETKPAAWGGFLVGEKIHVQQMGCIVDELRLHNEARSADYVKFSYENQKYGSEVVTVSDISDVSIMQATVKAQAVRPENIAQVAVIGANGRTLATRSSFQQAESFVRNNLPSQAVYLLKLSTRDGMTAVCRKVSTK